MDLNLIPVGAVKGVGAQRADDLVALGVTTIAQLLEYYPFRYEDYRLRELSEVKDGDKITVQGVVYSEPIVQRYGRSKTRMTCRVMIESFLVTAVFFNRHFLKDRIHTGETIVLTGKWEQKRLQLTVSETEFPGKGTSRTGSVQPVYSVGAGVSQRWLRKTIAHAFQQYGTHLEEMLPREFVEKYRFISRREAVGLIHNPETVENGQTARRRIVYEELFLFQLKMQAFRTWTRNKQDGVPHAIDLPAARAFVRSLPFILTVSQKNVLADILHDLQQTYAMNRLLQGDVGSGKTVVAAVALFAVVKAGAQGALMVPTEILAEQHVRSLGKLFAGTGIEVALLTGSMPAKQRRDVIGGLQMGLIDVVVGTHALIQEDVFFRQLGLVVTDEQHRFGVNQRTILRRKGMNPDVLSMTATPIPRTLAITAYGDLDVSSLRERPKGRLPIKTYAVTSNMMERVLGFIHREVETGRQVYVICPLIEESDKLDVQNAIDVQVQLQQHFPRLRVGLLHGRMPAQEKDAVMAAFKDNLVHVLVSTTVIEVGVDVPNATLMVVYDAERFGLSQLHQLRGRVGRGEHQSYCVLIADPKSEIGKERMRVMTETDDGFEIARRDLELRGPGDFFGTKQSGLPDFRVADMVVDFETLEIARDDAATLVSRSDFWTGVEYLPLRQYLQRQDVFAAEPLD